MENHLDLYFELSKLPYFSRTDIRAISQTEKAVELFLYRASRKGEIIRLRRGLYTTRHYVDEVQRRGEMGTFLEFLANIIHTPSYLSGEYILAKHELLTEAVTTMTSITSNRPMLVENDLGTFRYRNITSNALGEFLIKQQSQYQIKQATKVQALFEYLYFKKRELKVLNIEVAQQLRLNLQNLSHDELREVHARAARGSSKKLIRLISFLEDLHAAE